MSTSDKKNAGTTACTIDRRFVLRNDEKKKKKKEKRVCKLSQGRPGAREKTQGRAGLKVEMCCANCVWDTDTDTRLHSSHTRT